MIPGVQDAWDRWFEWKDRLVEEQGLALGLDYTAAGLGASKSVGKGAASGGAVRFFGFWDLVGRGTPDVGSFVWRLEHRHRYSTIPPADLAENIGYAGEIDPDLTDEGFRFTNLYWNQLIDGDRAFIAGGFLDNTDYLDTYPLGSTWTGFINSVFDTGSATIGFPEATSLGVAGAIMFGRNFYGYAGLTNANANPADPFSEVGSFFEERDYFTSVEVGWDRRVGAHRVRQCSRVPLASRREPGEPRWLGSRVLRGALLR